MYSVRERYVTGVSGLGHYLSVCLFSQFGLLMGSPLLFKTGDWFISLQESSGANGGRDFLGPSV